MTDSQQSTLDITDLSIGNGTGLRPETHGDREFLEKLYFSVRWQELAATGWSDEQKRLFLLDQLSLQSRHYHTHYNGGLFSIIEQNRLPIGRLYLFSTDHELRVVDISLLPEHRNRGTGGAVMTAVIAAAQKRTQRVSLHVELFNPAQRLYQRLGFYPVGEVQGFYQKMELNQCG